MNRLLHRLQSAGSLFRVRYDYSNALDRQRAQSLVLIAWGGLGIVLLYLIFYLLGSVGSGLLTQAIVSFISVIIGISVVVLLLNQGNLGWASVVFVFLLYVGAAAIMLRYLPTITVVNLFALSMPIVAGGLLLNRRGAIITVGVVLLTFLILKMVDWLGLTASLAIQPLSSVQDLAFSVIAVVVDGILLATFAGGQRRLLQQNLTLSRELRGSIALSQTLTSILSIDELLARAADMLRHELGYYHVQVFLIEEETRLLQLRTSTSASPTVIKARRPVNPDTLSAFSEAIQTGHPVKVSAADSPERRSEFLAMTQAQLLVPLIYGGKLLGILDIQRTDATSFTATEIDTLQTIGGQLAVSIQNVQLTSDLQALHEERDQLSVQLREMNRKIDQISQEAGEKSWNRFLQGKGMSLVGLDWNEGAFTPSETAFPGLDRVMDSVMPEIHIVNEEQILSIPIVLRGQTLGAMEFRAPAQQPWNNRSLELARIIAQRVALALDNIRLYEQAQTVARREQLVNRIASQLQSKTDIDSLMRTAAEVFQDALGATRASIRLNVSDQQAAAGANGEES